MINHKNARREKMKDMHSFSAWKKRMSKKTVCFNVNTLISKKDFSGLEQCLNWELVKKKSMPIERPGCKCTQYLFKNPEPEKKEELVLIRMTECDSFSNAHESIIDFMMTSTLPKFPNGEEVGLNVGDICFGSHAKIPVSVLFARDNLMVYVRSVGADDVNVEKVAVKIDEIIRTGAAVEPGKKKKPSPIKKTARVEEKVLLSIEGFDPKEEKLSCKITAPGGRITREKGELYYCPEKHGKHKIGILLFDEDKKFLSSIDYEVSVSKK
jgi:hypothetical protein